MKKAKQAIIPAPLLTALRNLQVQNSLQTWNLSVQQDCISVLLEFSTVPPPASGHTSAAIRLREDHRVGAQRYPDQTLTGPVDVQHVAQVPVQASAQQTAPAPGDTVAPRVTILMKTSKSTRRHNIKRSKAHRARKQLLRQEQVELSSDRSIGSSPFPDYPPLSPIPTTPEPPMDTSQNSQVGVRSLSGPPAPPTG